MAEPRPNLWQVVLLVSLLPGLLLMAILGAGILVWTGGSYIGIAVGKPMVIGAAAIAAHLIPQHG